MQKPLRRLTRKGVKWQWGNEQNNAIETLKKALSSEPVLACFKLENPTFVVADASPVGLGAVLLEKPDDLESVKLIAYVSRSLSQTERRNWQIEREALGCVWAVERFHNYLFGNDFTLLTDNKPLVQLLRPDSVKILPARIQRLSWRMQQYNYEIKHTIGKANIADSLSRLVLKKCTASAVSLRDVKEAIANDPFMSELYKLIELGEWSDNIQFKAFQSVRQELSIYEGIILRENSIVMPKQLNV